MKLHGIRLSTLAFITLCLGFGPSVSSAMSYKNCKDKELKVHQHLMTFADLDFNVFSNQKWDELKKSHASDIIVHWPDGRVTKGIEQHIEDLKKMFVSLPDTRITSHPIKFGQDNWTSVMGFMEGTFTKPMDLGGGKIIQPNGNKVKLAMSTIGKWNKDGVMEEEYLFWDNATYMKQLGLLE